MLDCEILAVRHDDLLGGGCVIEAEAAGAHDEELALHRLGVRLRLHERAFECLQVTEIL